MKTPKNNPDTNYGMYLLDRIAKEKAQPKLPSVLQSAEDHRREYQNGADDESDSFADSYYSLRDEGRNPDGSGESYAGRNV